MQDWLYNWIYSCKSSMRMILFYWVQAVLVSRNFWMFVPSMLWIKTSNTMPVRESYWFAEPEDAVLKFPYLNEVEINWPYVANMNIWDILLLMSDDEAAWCCCLWCLCWWRKHFLRHVVLRYMRHTCGPTIDIVLACPWSWIRSKHTPHHPVFSLAIFTLNFQPIIYIL